MAPTYDYSCKKCGTFEKLQKMSDDPITACPECNGPVKRLIGAGCGIIFRGTGFPGNDLKKAREQ